MTPEEKKLWQCYHARAMQGYLSSPETHASIGQHVITPQEVAGSCTEWADLMLAEAKKKGAV